ncbi:MAG TPA: class I SAM-dependent methyltransferase [Kofleriaceae bacterium]|nr:class I SAM-dependent methyltransferase [Kofleriaceae bacterium]
MANLSVATKLAYRAQHLALLVNTTALQESARVAMRQPRPKIDRSLIALLRERRAALHATDLANVERGYYPAQLLFGFPFKDYAKQAPTLLRETPRLLQRKRAQQFRDLPAIDLTQYPHYYRRTFHWQTDGYFSERSAALYDVGVELLFRGTADVMRRQVLPPIAQHLANLMFEGQPRRGPSDVKIADIACGTGRLLNQLAQTYPTTQLFGVDLSPYYVAHAQRQRHSRNIRIEAGNAEQLPYADASMDVLTCVYLFHELPRATRRVVLREMLRVLQPGGLLVIEDSAQLADSPTLAPVLENFPVEFHEPFYREYLSDDLAAICREVGFTVESSEPHLVAKVVVARKPLQS